MASQEPKSDIVDLLYDDELDEESREALHGELETDEEARRELEDFQEVLGAVRQADLQEEPSEAVHESIIAAAREHAAKSTSRQARVTKRAPAPSRDEKGLWSRLNSSGLGQLVLAASVVLVAGFVFVQLAGERSASHKFQAAEDAVDSQIRFGGPEPTAEEIARSEAATGAAQDEQERAEEEPAGDRSGAEAGAAIADRLDGDEDEQGQLARAEAPQEEPKAPAQKEAKTKAKTQESKESALGKIAKLDEPPQAKTRARRARKARPRKKSAKKDDNIELFGTEKSSKSSGKRDGVALDLDQQREAGNQRPTEEAAESDDSAISDVADLGSLAGNSVDEQPSSASGRASSASAGAPANEPESKADSDDDAASQSSVSTIESRYQSGNYAGVVTQADRYLSRSSGDDGAKTDEARVLELKARALARQGKSAEADRTYAELQKQYPSYKSDHVERERKALADQQQEKRRRRSMDTDMEMERQADEQEAGPVEEPDQTAPSSLETY